MATSRICLGFATLALFVISSALADEVVVLTGENFGKEVGQDRAALVEFYAPGSGQCKTLATDEFEKLGKIFKKEKSVLIGKVDCDEHEETCNKFGVSEYPTIKWFPKGSLEPKSYDGARTAEALVEYVNSEGENLGDELELGIAKLRIVNAAEAPLEESKLRVLLVLTGQGNGTDRPGLVQDLELTISPLGNSIIEKVSAGDYPQSRDKGNAVDSPVTVIFGNLYDKETRRVKVDLVLPEVTSEISSPVFEIGCMYSNGTGKQQSPPVSARVQRTGSRLKTADLEMMIQARQMAQSMLDDVEVNVRNTVLEMLKEILDQLMEYLQSDMYKNRGDTDKFCMFSTPRMDVCQEEAKEFDKSPTKPVPAVEIAADPRSPIIGPLTVQAIQQAILALQSIETILTAGGRN